MGRLIDIDKARNEYRNLMDLTMSDTTLLLTLYGVLDNAPAVEAIPKADYENRLNADLKAILVDLQLEIEEMDSGCGWEGYRPTAQVIGLIQDKINVLKADGSEEGD